MRDVVQYKAENPSEFGDYDYLRQYDPDAEGVRFQPELDYLRMAEIHGEAPVPDGISGDRQMRGYLQTDLLDGNLTTERLARGLTNEEINDLVNYLGWYMYDFLALRASEGRSELIPRQEYEAVGITWTTLRYGEFYKVLLDKLGIEGLIDLGETKRREMGTQVRPGGLLHMLTSPPFGAIALKLQEVIDPEDPLIVDWLKYFYTVPLAIQHGLTGQSGLIAPCQNRYVVDYKHEDVVEFAADHLQPVAGETKSTLRQFMASAELFAYLMHYDNRTGLDDHGPYFLEDGKPMILRDIWLDDPFLPWGDIASDRDLPYCVTVAFTLDPAELDLTELRVEHTTFTQPSNYLEAIDAGAAFIREQPEQAERVPLEDIQIADIEADLPPIKEKVDAGTGEWYRQTARLSRREKIMNGARTYSVGFIEPFLSATGSYDYFCEQFDLWEAPPMTSDMYYTFHDPEAFQFFAEQVLVGTGWTELTGETSEESAYAQYLGEAKTEKNWQSDLTGMQEIPTHFAEKMNEHDQLDVPITKMEGDVGLTELGDHLESL